MLTFAFFISAFVSATWLIYSLIYINSALGEQQFTSLPLQEGASYVALVLLPILVMWMIFGYAQQFFASKYNNRRTYKLLQQMKKNQDYTDLMVRIMIDAEHEIKDGFILNKFDLFISDLNEMLADLLMRCNLVSSGQMENLWNKVLHGERWSIAKILLSNSPVGYDVADKIFEYAKRDQIVAGTLLEFCSRYQMLASMLEKHDKDGVFLSIIQTGVMGKAYSILAPVSEQIQFGTSNHLLETPRNTEKIVTKVLEEENQQEAPKKSLFSAITSAFHKKDEEDDDEEKEEGFFSDLSSDGEKKEPTFSSAATEPDDGEYYPEVKSEEDAPEDQKNESGEELSYPFGGWTDEKNYKN